MINIGIFTDSTVYLNFCKSRPYMIPITCENYSEWEVGKIGVQKFPKLKYLWAYDEVLRRVDNIRPVMSRHFDSEPKRDLLNRDITLRILNIMSALEECKIQRVIFTTNSSHWLDSQMLEIGCAVLKIPQIFLYAIWLNGRILPMIQIDGISSRQRFNENISAESFEEDIKSVSDLGFRYFFNADWKVSNNKFLSFLRPVIFHLKTYIHNSLRQFLGRISRTESFGGRKIGLLTELRLVADQIEAIKVLKQYITEDSIDTHCTKEGSIIIFAHYQPEATTFPEAGLLWNHLDLVIKLKRENPGLTIFYKEHPDMFSFNDSNNSTRGGIARSKKYYEQLRSLGVKFVEDIPNCNNCIPLTMNGTIGVERSLKGLPTIVAGFPWYQGLPGTYSLRILKNEGFRDLSNTPDTVVSQKAEDFLCQILNFKTITNVTGISGFHLKNSSTDFAVHSEEFANLIKKISTSGTIQNKAKADKLD